VDEAAVLLSGFLVAGDRLEAAFAADRFAGRKLRALLAKLRGLLLARGLLAALALGGLDGGVLLDRRGATRRASLSSIFDPASSWGS
jgi:hypothetical protein